VFTLPPLCFTHTAADRSNTGLCRRGLVPPDPSPRTPHAPEQHPGEDTDEEEKRLHQQSHSWQQHQQLPSPPPPAWEDREARELEPGSSKLALRRCELCT